MVAGSVKCVKYTLFLFNLIFSVSSRGKLIHRHRFGVQMIAQMNLFRGQMIDHRKRFDGQMIDHRKQFGGQMIDHRKRFDGEMIALMTGKPV